MTKLIADEEQAREDGLDEYVRRINAAVKYTGEDDHEDVRTVLKALIAQAQQQLLAELLAEVTALKKLPHTDEVGSEYKYEGYINALDQVVSIINKYLTKAESEQGEKG